MTRSSPPAATNTSIPSSVWSRRNSKRAGTPRWNTSVSRRRGWRAFDARTVPAQQVDARALQALAQDLPALWHDPATDMRLKQRIVRILIQEIIVDIDDASREIVLVMHWQGGRHTELRVATPWSGRTKRCTDAEAIALVRRMAGRWNDDAIAMQLNLLGWKTGTGNHWTRMRVRELRSRLDLPACDPTQPAWLTAKGAATPSRHQSRRTPACSSNAASSRARKPSRAVCGGSILRSSTRRNSARPCVR